MAQQNTGMGWSAKEEWLLQGAGEIAEVVAGEGQLPVFNNPSKLDIELNGVTLWLNPNNGQWCKAVAGGPGVYGYARESTSALMPGAIATGNTSVFYYAYSYSNSVLTNTINSQVPNHSGWYFGVVSQGITTSVNPTTDVPVYNAASDGDAAGLAVDNILAMSFQIDKTNIGHAVACVVRWKTQNGTELISPILISSNSDYVEMTATSATYNFAKFNGLLDGMRFYMGFWDIPGSAATTSLLQPLDLTGRGNLDLQTLFMIIISTNNAHVIVIHSPDPYEEEGGGSGEEGGDGEDTEDDEHGIEGGDDFPSAINTGFCRIFTPSESDLQALSSYLWSSSYDLTQVKKLFSNPMDSIIGLSAVPIRLSGSSVNFSLGGVPITGLTLPLVSKQRYSYFMGSITVKERWGSYLDYDPYTKFSIFLPFIGMRELSTDDIMGKTVGLHYDFDILSGTCVARLQVGKLCLYEWGGTCALQLPINSRNWDSVFNTAVGAVSGIVSAAASGGAPLVAGSVASAALQTVSMKPRIDKSGSINGAAGWLGQMRPYLIRTTPEAYVASDQNTFIGYPSYMSVSLGNLTGYNEIESVHLENIPATGDELAELESILKGGVIF